MIPILTQWAVQRQKFRECVISIPETTARTGAHYDNR
jgi:hypothetical protein